MQHAPSQYIKIYFVLLGLFLVSVTGPMLGVRALTLITAFGIAVVKALLVVAYFMHLNIEKKYIWQLLSAMLLLVALFYGGTMADVNRTYGRNWTNQSAEKLIEENRNAVPEAHH